MTLKHSELTADELTRRCRVEDMCFVSTEELPELTEIIGQERATRAVEFGIDIQSYGYNVYAMGPAGAGKTTTIMSFLERKAGGEATPSDWVYVNNFQKPEQPNAIRFDAGMASRFSQATLIPAFLAPPTSSRWESPTCSTSFASHPICLKA